MGQPHPMAGHELPYLQDEELFGAPSSSSILEFYMKGRDETEGGKEGAGLLKGSFSWL